MLRATVMTGSRIGMPRVAKVTRHFTCFPEDQTISSGLSSYRTPAPGPPVNVIPGQCYDVIGVRKSGSRSMPLVVYLVYINSILYALPAHSATLEVQQEGCDG